MNYDAIIASAIHDFSCARDFHKLFPNAEHIIVNAQRDFSPDGWKPVSEWISRAHLHDRYVVWLVVAIEIAKDGTITELEKPELYVVELEKVEKSKDEKDGPEWGVGILQFEDGDWDKLVENGGDFTSVELEMTMDAPVDRFNTFWRDTRPPLLAAASDGGCFRAPLRFMQNI